MTDLTNSFTPEQQDLEWSLPPTFDSVEAERSTARSAWPAPCASSVGSGSARAWPGTSRPAIPSSPTTSGSTRSA